MRKIRQNFLDFYLCMCVAIVIASEIVHILQKKKSCLVFTIALDVVTIVVIISHLTKKEMKFKE